MQNNNNDSINETVQNLGDTEYFSFQVIPLKAFRYPDGCDNTRHQMEYFTWDKEWNMKIYADIDYLLQNRYKASA